MSIAQTLAPHIKKAGISQTARAAGIPRSTLSEWLAGKRNRRLGDRQLDAVCRALGITLTITEDSTCSLLPEDHSKPSISAVTSASQSLKSVATQSDLRSTHPRKSRSSELN